MPVGRASPNRGRRGRREESSAGRPGARARRTGTAAKTKVRKPGRQSTARPRTKANRARASTAGAFQLSSTRRAAVLATVVCAMALSISVPLRTYLSQQAELDEQRQRQEQLLREVEQLEQRKRELNDPAHVEAEALERLGYVRPGETPYIVELPDTSPEAPERPRPAAGDVPWYEELWNSLLGKES